MPASSTPVDKSWLRRLPRFLFVATVSAVSFALLGLCLFRPGEPRQRLEVVLRTGQGYDWETDAPAGPLFTDGDLQAAVRWSTGVIATREDLRRLRGDLRIRVERPAGEPATRIRLALTARNRATGEAMLKHLSQVALLRLHLSAWFREQETLRSRQQLSLDAARQGEVSTQGRLHAVVRSWLEREQSAPTAPLAQRQPLNPRWEELLERRKRLTSRVETLLETHRRSHPIVTRINAEIDRLALEMESTPRMIAQASAVPSSGGARRVAATIPTSDSLRLETERQDFSREFTRVWEQVLSARREFDASLQTTGAPEPQQIQTLAWVEKPVRSRSVAAGIKRGWLVLLAALAGGLMLAAGEQHLRLQPQSERQTDLISQLERPLDLLLILMAIVTALLAFSVIHELIAGESFWLPF